MSLELRYEIEPSHRKAKVDWGVEGKFWGIICKHDSRHPSTPWTMYYPKDGDMEHGRFAKGFSEWRALDESRPGDPLTVRKILQWYCEVPPMVLPQPPAGWNASAFEPLLGTRAELPHNRAEADSDSGSDPDDDVESAGSGGGGGSGAAAAASANLYELKHAVGGKRSAMQQSTRPKKVPPPVEFPEDATNWDVIVAKEATSGRYQWAYAQPGTAQYPSPASAATGDNASSGAASSSDCAGAGSSCSGASAGTSCSGTDSGTAASSGAARPRLHPNEVTDPPVRRHLLEAVGLWAEVAPDCVVLLFRLEDIIESSRQIKVTGVCPPALADLTGRDFVVLARLPPRPPAGGKAARERVAPLAVCRQLRGATQGPREPKEGAGAQSAAAAEPEAAAAAEPEAAAPETAGAAAGPEAAAAGPEAAVAAGPAAAAAAGPETAAAAAGPETAAAAVGPEAAAAAGPETSAAAAGPEATAAAGPEATATAGPKAAAAAAAVGPEAAAAAAGPEATATAGPEAAAAAAAVGPEAAAPAAGPEAAAAAGPEAAAAAEPETAEAPAGPEVAAAAGPKAAAAAAAGPEAAATAGPETAEAVGPGAAAAGPEAAAAAGHEPAVAAGPKAVAAAGQEPAAAAKPKAAAKPEAGAARRAKEVAQLFEAAKAGGAFQAQPRGNNKTTAGGGALETSGMTFAARTSTSSPGWYAHLRDPEHGARRRGLLAALLRGLCLILAAQHGHHTAMLRAYSGNGSEPLGPGTGPFCTVSYTTNYANRPHLDQSDPPLSYITWWLAGLGALLGGAFRLANVRVRFTPLQGTTLLLNSRLLYHGTERCHLLLPSGQRGSGSIQRIGSALWLRDTVVGSWLAWRAGAQRRFPGVGVEEAEALANARVAAAAPSERSAKRRAFIEAGRGVAEEWFKHEAVAEEYGCWGVAELPEGVRLPPLAC
ncbi:hypothetical protein TSOC_005964 [Tetrabaena socialis]|uniref:Uncharacterized protein n=1 Tax=Tetrabaena socialis TaxID=47790 RepID=A0A2J8A4Y1_9CHLO|nr:hypothetical protein TSOC_005964 [Tetrabaena socialis]|eukprot:PNH07571.1 hypothetical protein TSOC_005964 [Tetrabaena socialis]